MNDCLVDQLIKEKYLKTPAIIEAFRKVKRADFVPNGIKEEKGEDFANEYNAPLPIGYGQTVSQPLTVALMLELLQPKPGDKVMDIGSGSGWQTALLCQIVGPKGFVYAIEVIPDLRDFGQGNIRKYGFKNTEFICGDGSKGLSDQAPFDKIIVAADAPEVPKALKDQLKIGGRLVLPVKGSIWLLIKEGKNKFKEEEHPGFVFVPLIYEKKN
jgi:protein-L-isoaspartate(D-aspartate) O-methyltransferase